MEKSKDLRENMNNMIKSSDVEKLIDECPRSAQELEDLPLYSILIVLSGYIAIGIGSFHFVFSLFDGFNFYSLIYLMTNLIFGSGLLISYYRIKKGSDKWILIAIVFSFILIGLQGTVGVLSGIVGVSGGFLALLGKINEDWRI